MSLRRVEDALFVLFCGMLPWLDMKVFPLPGAFVRPSSLIPMFLGIVLIAVRIAFRRQVNLEVLRKLLPWFCVLVVVTILSFFIYPGADWQVKDRTRLTSCLREFLGVFTVLSGFAYCGHNLYWSRPLRKRIFRAIYIGSCLSLIAGTIQIGWFFFKSSLFEAIGRAIQSVFLAQMQIGKVHGLTPEGSMYADLSLTLIFPLFFARFLTALKKKEAILSSSILLSLSLLTLLGTSSRPGLIGLAFSLFVGSIATSTTVKSMIFKTLGIAVLASGLFAILLSIPQYNTVFNSSFQNLTDIEASYTGENWSNVTRAATQIAAYSILMKHPLGIGLGQYMFFARAEMPQWAFLSPEVQAMYGTYNTGSSYCNVIDCEAVYADPKNMILRIGLDWSPLVMVMAIVTWLRFTYKILKIVRQNGGETETFVFYALLPMPLLCISVSSYMWLHWMFVLTLAYYLIQWHKEPGASGGLTATLSPVSV